MAGRGNGAWSLQFVLIERCMAVFDNETLSTEFRTLSDGVWMLQVMALGRCDLAVATVR